MTIWDDDTNDPRPGASRAVTAAAALFVAIAWALAFAVQSRSSAGILSVGVLLLGGWVIGLLIISIGLVLSGMSLVRVMRENARNPDASRAHFWVALLLVVTWPVWMVFALDTVLSW